MKYGIYYAYWAKEWGGDYIPYIQKVKSLGFDILEVACGDFHNQPDEYFAELRRVAKANDIILTGGYGPRSEHNLSSPDVAIVRNAFSFYQDVFRKMEIADIASLGGALYSYWPIDYNNRLDKAGDLERSINNMKVLADMALDHGITLYMEVLNRFEGYLLNECSEAVSYIEAVNKPNVKMLLDTFHMNIEEDSFAEAIKLAGKYLGELHVGEANRKPPRKGRMPWKDIADSLNEIGFDGNIVMEPFVTMEGQVGRDIRVWRDISKGASMEDLDMDAERSATFLRNIMQ